MNEKQIAAMRQALEKFQFMSHVDSIFHGEFDDEIAALKAALADNALDKMAENERELGIQMQLVETTGWRNAAIRLGEELSSAGPDGYYDMSAEQWLDWAMAQEPRGKNSQPAQQEPVAWMDGYRNIYSLEEKAAGCEDAVIPLYPYPVEHWSDCAVNNEPAYPAGECDCGGYTRPQAREPLTNELPALPEGKGVVRGPVAAFSQPECGTLVDFDCEGPLSHDPGDGEELFTADQMREYANAAIKAAHGIKGDA